MTSLASTSSAPTRAYGRLSASDDADLRRRWEGGHETLEELACRFAMSKRGIQAALKRLGAVKGASLAIWPRADVLGCPIVLPEGHDNRVSHAMEAAFRNACELEALAMAAARTASAELSGVSALRALDLAASVTGKTRAAMWAVLGLDGRLPVGLEDLPELPIREMTLAEIHKIRREQEKDDARQNGDNAEEVDELADDVIEE